MNLPDEPTDPPAAQAGAGPATPDDVQQLEAEIDRTREQLGATVDQLAAKMDVKSRARTKAAQLAGQAKARANAAQLAGRAKARANAAQLAGRAKARANAAQLAGRAKGTATGIREQARPERMRQAAAKGASTARERPVPLAVAAAVLIAAYLAIRQWRKR
jgi:Protein of unknown function (DUF3618)